MSFRECLFVRRGKSGVCKPDACSALVNNHLNRPRVHSSTTAPLSSFSYTNLCIYILDAVPHIHVVPNHVDTDKLTTANGENLRRAQPVAVANHAKARQSLIERSELAEI